MSGRNSTGGESSKLYTAGLSGSSSTSSESETTPSMSSTQHHTSHPSERTAAEQAVWEAAPRWVQP